MKWLQFFFSFFCGGVVGGGGGGGGGGARHTIAAGTVKLAKAVYHFAADDILLYQFPYYII